ncbi:MAG TPA: DUF4097 family beta strand repeat-containing protein [Mobilitalea sp.]|nr:DUF4097 family beta strand repeat-containing protein [Mobilitalea sp.]
MNKYRTVQVICWIIVFFVFVGLSIWIILGGHLKMGFSGTVGIRGLSGPYNEVGRYNIDASGIKNVDFDWVAGEVTVIVFEGDDIQLVEYAQRTLEADEVLAYDVSGNNLNVEFCEKKMGFLDNMPPKKVEVFIPTELADGFTDFLMKSVSAQLYISDIKAEYFEAVTVSGDAEINNINADEIKLSTTSGNFILKDLDAPKATMKSVSGEITLKGMETDEVSTKTTSGTVKLEDINTDKVSFDTVSGEVFFGGHFKKLTVKSTSGDIDITEKVVPEAFQIRTVSGRVNIAMPAFEGFRLYNKSTSGELSCDIPVIKGDDGSEFRIKTTSGDVEIEELK